MKLLVDSSVLIEFLRTGRGVWLDLLGKAKVGEVVLITSVVVIHEIWAGRSMGKSEIVNDVEELFNVIEVISLTEDIVKISGELERSGVVRSKDAMIAATCLVEKAVLATLNRKHFEKVEGLELSESCR